MYLDCEILLWLTATSLPALLQVAVCCIEVCMRLYGGRVKQTSSTRKLPRQHKSLQEMTERLPTKGTEQDEKEEEKMREEDEEEIEG